MLHRDLSHDICTSHSHPWGKMCLLASKKNNIVITIGVTIDQVKQRKDNQMLYYTFNRYIFKGALCCFGEEIQTQKYFSFSVTE